MADKRPNILFICSDQHTPRVMGAYGDRIIATPNLDALAAEGCRFDSFYCNNPVCCPSRMSLMTGRYSFQCESITNQSVLDSRIPTLAHIAVRGGYHAVLAGKMHFNGPDQRHGFLERPMGEASTLGLLNGGDRKPAEPKYVRWLGNCSRPEPLFYTGAGGNALADYDLAVTSATEGWLDGYAKAGDVAPPFFLTVGFLLPHCPYIAPRKVYDKYDGRVTAPHLARDQLDALHPHHKDFRKYIQLDDVPPANFDRAAVAYYGLTDQLDQNVGRIFDSLNRNGLWENTIVIYTSDHGEMLGQHGRWHKESFYEDSVRVPFVVRHPSQKMPASVAAHCSLVDLMPTLCEWMGVKPPPGLDGTSLVPILAGAAADPNRTVKAETYTFWHTHKPGLSSNRMVRRGPWKLCYYGAYDAYELFNLVDDPEETNDVSRSPGNEAIVRELRAEIFSDGWSADTAQKIEERLAGFGHPENMKEFRDVLRSNPLPMDSPDQWPAWATARTFLE
ncbi:choline-sulfatase [soil metagenome]